MWHDVYSVLGIKTNECYNVVVVVGNCPAMDTSYHCVNHAGSIYDLLENIQVRRYHETFIPKK
jgi:hypothetical protein